MKKIQRVKLWACSGVERLLIEEYQDEYLDYMSKLELPRISKFEPLKRDAWLQITFEEPVEVKEEEAE
jgi:hypothetical protein